MAEENHRGEKILRRHRSYKKKERPRFDDENPDLGFENARKPKRQSSRTKEKSADEGGDGLDEKMALSELAGMPYSCVLSYDKEESYLRGYIPLDTIKDMYNREDIQIDSISFYGNGYCTDAVLKVLSTLPKAVFEDLSSVDLTGCDAITDWGAVWLEKILKFSTKLKPSVIVDACELVTERFIFGIQRSCDVSMSMRATGVTYSVYQLNTAGCPNFNQCKGEIKSYLNSHILILPEKSITTSMAQLFVDGQKVARKEYMRIKDWQFLHLNITLTEISTDSILYKTIMPEQPQQAVIPVNLQSDIKTAKEHVIDTITNILLQEKPNPPHSLVKVKHTDSLDNLTHDRFITLLRTVKMEVTDDGVLSSTSNSESMFMSARTLTRSYPYFDVECLTKEDQKTSMFCMGVWSGTLCDDRDTAGSQTYSVGVAEAFQFGMHRVCRFGIEGDWESEYVPKKECKFYKVEDGKRTLLEEEKAPCSITELYPVVSIFGRQKKALKLLNYAKRPPDSIRLPKGQKWMEPFYCTSLCYTGEGIVSCLSEETHVSAFLLLQPGITEENTSCTIKIISLGRRGNSYFGIAMEDYSSDNLAATCFITSDSAKVGTDMKHPWNVHDEIKVDVSKLSIKDNTVYCHVVFSINGNKVSEFPYQNNNTDGSRCMFCVGLSSQDRIQIYNFRDKYVIPPLISSHITHGRCYELELMDDGTLQKGEDWKTGGTSQFISNTPLSASMPSFELELVNLDTKQIAIGLCSQRMRTAVIPGKMLDSLGYVVDSGKVHAKNKKGIKPTGNTKFGLNKLGTFTCGVEIDQVKLTQDGQITSGQNVPVYFSFNGQKFYTLHFEHWSEGLYPIIALAGKDEVKLKNFCVENRELASKVARFSKEGSDVSDICDGCQFTVVGVKEKEDSEVSFTVDDLQQQIDLRNDLPITTIEKEVHEMERNLNGLDFQGQLTYSQHCSVLERMQKLVATPKRLHYLSFVTETRKGDTAVIEHLASNIQSEINTHPFCYELPDLILQMLDVIQKRVQTEKIVKKSDLYHSLRKEFPQFYKMGWYHHKAVLLLHEQGKVTFLQQLVTPVVVDPDYLSSLYERLSGKPKHKAKDFAASVHPSTEVWLIEEVMDALKDDVSKNKEDILTSVKFVKEVLEKNFGFMYIPCLRTDVKDELFVVTKHSSITEAPISLDSFRSVGANSRNYRIIRKTYKFHWTPDRNVYVKLFNKTMVFGQPLVCAPTAIVMQNGAVQTMIVGSDKSLILESRCYSPKDYEVESAHEDIEAYTWNVFCIYTDLIELVLKGSGVLYTAEGHIPKGLANKSIGCYHTWKVYKFKVPETICTLCNKCTHKGEFCQWNGLTPAMFRQCGCETQISGCRDCGICKDCARELWRIRTRLRPCLMTCTGRQDLPIQEEMGLNLETFNDMEMISLTSNNVPVYLRQLNSNKKDVQIHPFSAGRSKYCEGDRIYFRVKEVENDTCKIQIFKNRGHVNQATYGLYKENTGRTEQLWHTLVIPEKFAGKYVLKLKRFPTHNFTDELQRGMTMVCKVEHNGEDVYPRCMFLRTKQVNNTDHYEMEYSVPDQPDNSTVTASPSELMNFTWNDFRAVWDYKIGSVNYKRKKLTVIKAPEYLLSGGSILAAKSNASGITKSLKKCSRCLHITRHVTVQEQRIMAASRGLVSWYGQVRYIGAEDHTFTHLPADMSPDTLTYPGLQDIFENTTVHKLCFLINQLVHLYDAEKFDFNVRIPMHLVDQAGIKPQNDLSTEEKYGNILAAWVHTSLIANKILLPSYEQLLSDSVRKRFSRSQIEVLLHNMLRITTSFCHILAEHLGGTTHLIPLPNGNKKIKTAIEYRKDLANVKQYTKDAHVMMETGLNVVCKAHFLCIDSSVEGFFDSDEDISYDYFHPYEETITALHWSDVELKSVSSKFYKTFLNLEFIQMAFVENLKSLPKGVSKLKHLKSIKMEETSLEKLPDDLMMSPSLENITFSYCPVKSLPTKWLPNLNLTHLNLPNMLLTELPEEIGTLQELIKLDVSGNLIEKLPSSFENLKNLTRLDLSGFPWLTQGRVGDFSLTREKYHDWIDSTSIKHYIDGQKLDDAFTQFDKKKCGELDREEIAELNSCLFFLIPRIGTQCLKKNAPKSSDFPRQICKLEKLTELTMRFQGITFVPEKIGNLQNLKMLNLKNCPLLEALPGALGKIDKLRTLQVRHCPSIRTPPVEVIGRGTASIKAYLKRLSEGYTECRRTKLMLVGLGGVGKTSLIKALLSKNKKIDRQRDEVITDGIDIRPWTIKIDDDLDVTFSTWDFAGQSLYYNTHQFFLSKRAVYFLLWSCRQGYEHAGLDFWLSSISCHAPDTPIFVIGTHYDECKADLPRTELKKRYPAIQGYHFISSIDGTGIQELQNDLIDVTLQQSYMNERIPKVWLNLETAILAKRNTEENYIDWKTMKNISLEVGIYEEDERKEAIQLLHNLGTLQYFDNDFLRHHIVINPQWIIDVMSCVVSVKQSPIKAANGHFHHKDTEIIWKVYSSTLHSWLMQLTEEFDLTFPLPSQPVNLVPCLLPEEPPEELKWPPTTTTDDVSEASIIYRFSYIPAGLFNRAQVRLFQFSDGKIIWKRGSLLQKNNHSALITQNSNGEMKVSVIGPRPFNILFLIHEIFESLVDEAFRGVKQDFNKFLMPCPLCVTKDVQEPWMFPADLVRCAMKSKTPFLQCMKMWNFHTVVISQFMEIMPENSADNFDANLQRSISALQEINNSLSEDIVLLYSSNDVPDGDERNVKIHPLQIKKYLEDNGYSWSTAIWAGGWYVEDKKSMNIGDMTLAVKNCKVVVALLSDNFERDTDCKNMLLHAMDDFKKHYVIVQLNETEDWKKSDIGMRIGTQEVLIMLKTQDRFESKITDLGGKLQKIKESQESKTTPVCFLSYCWTNSHSAAISSRKSTQHASEDADPRKLKEYLESNGISCWLDKDQLGRKGMYDEISSGIRNAKVFVACVSDQYVLSDNCMMEFRFAFVELERPTVIAVVGTGSKWRQSEIKFLLQKRETAELSFQEDGTAAAQLKNLLQCVKKAIPTNADQLLKQEELTRQSKLVVESIKSSNSSLCYQEEFELIQRKFMRHVVSYISKQDSVNFPRLLVLDFANNSENTDNWKTETVVVKILCENEEGWHVCDKTLELGNANMLEEWLRKACPFLARIYAILKQSSISLYCMNGKKGDEFQEWIKQTVSELQNDAETGKIERLDFMDSYVTLRNFVTDNYSTGDFIKQLDKCHLPTGKVYWLCGAHQEGIRITKLTFESGANYNKMEVLELTDTLLREALEKSDVYKNRSNRRLKHRTSSTLSGATSVIKDTSDDDGGALNRSDSVSTTNTIGQDNRTDNMESNQKQVNDSLSDKRKARKNKKPSNPIISSSQKDEEIVPTSDQHKTIERDNQSQNRNRTDEAVVPSIEDSSIPLKRKFKAAGHVAGTTIAATKFVARKKNDGSRACVIQ